ncbi:hypothetical protein ScPMuIL_012390, partial [Solemya velum]
YLWFTRGTIKVPGWLLRMKSRVLHPGWPAFVFLSILHPRTYGPTAYDSLSNQPTNQPTSRVNKKRP